MHPLHAWLGLECAGDSAEDVLYAVTAMPTADSGSSGGSVELWVVADYVVASRVASLGWLLEVADAKNAFCQSDPLSRPKGAIFLDGKHGKHNRTLDARKKREKKHKHITDIT